MLNIEFYKTSLFFQYKEFKAWTLVFDEWEIDENLYIIISWKVWVEKYTTIEKKETKELAVLADWDFFWEASLGLIQPKEALVKAISDLKVLYIDWKNWIQWFIKKFPKEWLDLFNYIIETTNKRLLKANKQITANYEIVKSIIWIEKINDKNIFSIIEKIKLITWYDYILFFEINPVVSHYLSLKYDTRESWKLQDKVIERWDIDNFEKLDNIILSDNNFVQKLSIWDIDLWFMIFGKDTEFTYDDKKLIASISNNLTWLLKQKEIMKEELNRNYMKNV